ncbi:glutamyl-tRNA reductase [Gemmatirosa kalamazoonensis]|uniref:glutamyl-tRNA reductase n=1 Tax=Gemmatirosa kalamazoonensis TaxID=861299 RepID=UPI00046D83DA|nr:glutamyl-tRNA reductase [Gemmatirosa kalamazoonensis]
MNLLVVGLDHRTAPLWIRERAAFASWAGAAREVAERAVLREVLVLSTCNRVELYGAADEHDLHAATERLIALLADRAAMPAELLRDYLVTYTGVAAAAHLARVASGMESMVLGETQIVSQIKRALTDARSDGVAGRVIERAVSLALAAGKRARPHLPHTSGVHSVAEAGVRALGGVAALSDASVVVVGAGATAADLLRALSGARTRRLVLVNRTLDRALPLAARHGAAVASWEALEVVVADADVVFTCTSSAAPVLRREHLARTAPRRRTFVDLGVPRNVAPELAEHSATRVIDVDSLGAWGQAGAATAHAHTDAEAEVSRWAARFERWQRTSALQPTIAQLRDEAARVRDLEVERALARLGAVDPREREIVREMATRLVNKLLHQPLAALSGDADAAALAASVRRLFALDADAPAVPNEPAVPSLPASRAATPLGV